MKTQPEDALHTLEEWETKQEAKTWNQLRTIPLVEAEEKNSKVLNISQDLQKDKMKYHIKNKEEKIETNKKTQKWIKEIGEKKTLEDTEIGEKKIKLWKWALLWEAEHSQMNED